MFRLCILPLSKLQECSSKRSWSSTSTWEKGRHSNRLRFWSSLKLCERAFQFIPQHQTDNTTVAICFSAKSKTRGKSEQFSRSSSPQFLILCRICLPRSYSFQLYLAFDHIWYFFSCLLKWFHMIHLSSWSVREPASLWASFANRSWPCRRTESATYFHLLESASSTDNKPAAWFRTSEHFMLFAKEKSLNMFQRLWACKFKHVLHTLGDKKWSTLPPFQPSLESPTATFAGKTDTVECGGHGSPGGLLTGSGEEQSLHLGQLSTQTFPNQNILGNFGKHVEKCWRFWTNCLNMITTMNLSHGSSHDRGETCLGILGDSGGGWRSCQP